MLKITLKEAQKALVANAAFRLGQTWSPSLQEQCPDCGLGISGAEGIPAGEPVPAPCHPSLCSRVPSVGLVAVPTQTEGQAVGLALPAGWVPTLRPATLCHQV